MAKGGFGFVGHARGRCVACKAPFIGKGDRCPSCAQALRARRKRKRR